MRKLQIEFRTAAEKDRGDLRTKFEHKSKEARAMLPQLGAAGEAALKANPADVELRDFLVTLADVALSITDDYELALRVCEALIKNSSEKNPPHASAYGIAATACTEVQPPRFDQAEKYLTQAVKLAGGDPPEAKTLRERIVKEKELWAAEAAIRDAEAKADQAAGTDPEKALPRVRLKIKDADGAPKGEIILELFENEAPNTVANFISLVEKGTYNGVAFHRVVPQFVIQGGDPKGDGTGGPGYRIPCECYEMKDGKPIFRRHFRGSLSMAHAGRDTGGSQFFICLSSGENVRNLDAKFSSDNKPDGGHTVFGRVVSGFDVMAQIQRRNPQRPQDQDVRPDRIDTATVIRKRSHPYVPKKVGEVEAKKEEKTPAKGKEGKTEPQNTKTEPEKTKAESEKTKTEEKTPAKS
jgi:cyclophilin family peptidyl-prolyl cis-trans isomerase